jgi:hypothetical protein
MNLIIEMTSFNHLMGLNEAISKIELRHNLLQQAIKTLNTNYVFITQSDFNSI